MTQLVTGEAVALDLRPAGLPSRVLAAAVDGFLQGVLLFGLGLLAVTTGTATSTAGQAALTVVVLLSVLAGYPVAFEALWRGRTPGKALLGLRVVRDDGGPIGFRQALVRGLAGAFVERPGVTVFTGAVVCMLLNEQGKRIGDLLAGTVVLRERVAVRPGPFVQVPAPLEGWARELDLSGLGDDLALSVRSFLARAHDLTPAARDDLGARLAGAVGAVVTPPAPAGTPGWAYLTAVLGERRRRAELGYGGPVAGPLDGSVREPVATPVRAPAATPAREAGETPARAPAATPVRAPAATPAREAGATPAREPAAPTGGQPGSRAAAPHRPAVGPDGPGAGPGTGTGFAPPA